MLSGPGPCPTLPPLGRTYTLVSTTGALTGAFGNAANNSVIADRCGSGAASYRINYTPTTVTATVVPPPPSATTDPASGVTASGATLNSTINPNGSATSYKYEYGTTTSFGTVIGPFDAGSGTTAVSQPGQSITGLTAKRRIEFARFIRRSPRHRRAGRWRRSRPVARRMLRPR